MKNVRVKVVGPIIHYSPDLTKVELCRMEYKIIEKRKKK